MLTEPAPYFPTLSTFGTVSKEEKPKVLDAAVKEVGRMLKDNLYDKFCITHEYKQIREQLDLIEQVEE